MVPAKWKTVENWSLNWRRTNIQSNFTLISLITFEVLNQTLPNLQGSCRNTSRWCLQIYMENGWELTKFTSKWITFKNIQSNFTLFWSTKSNFLQGSCRNTSRWCLQNYMENGWELKSELTSKKITFNIQSNFTLISSITFEVLNNRAVAVIPADGACKFTWETVENWSRNSRRNK